jgi:hypothetical protein
MENAITFSPQYKKSKELYENLKEELVKLIADHDDLVHVVKVNLEADYQLKIGKRQYDLFCVKVTALRLKRKMELLQASINKQEKCSIKEVERQLNMEFDQWQRQAQELYDKIKEAEFHDRLPRLSSEGANELKKLYHELAKKYHPDVNPDEPEKAKNLWLKISEAYQKSDLREMKTLALLAQDITAEVPELSSMEKLTKECDVLKEKIQEIVDKLAHIKTQFPFNIADQLQDEEWVQQQNATTDAEISQWQQSRDIYEEKVAELEYLIDQPQIH